MELMLLFFLGLALLVSCELAIQFQFGDLDELCHEALESTEWGIWGGFRAGLHSPLFYSRKRFGANPFSAPLGFANRSARLAFKLILLAGEFLVGQATANDLFHGESEPLEIRSLPLIEAEALLIGIGL